MSESARSPQELVNRLESVYVAPGFIDHEFELQRLFSLARSGPEYRRQRINRLAAQLSKISPCSIAFDAIRKRSRSATVSTVHQYDETALAYAGVLVDASLRYPNLKRAYATRVLNRAVKGEPEVPTLQTAGERILHIGKAIVRGEAYLKDVDVGPFAHPDDTQTRFKSIVIESVQTGDPDRVETTIEGLERARVREWDQSDLLTFDPIEFEHLLANCWRAYHNAAEATRGTKDRGIDVVVEKKNGEILVIQAKRYKEENTVGVAEVQRVAGLLEEFSADKAVLVTSSSFTNSATQSAANIARVELINGDRLCKLLNQSPLIPPLRRSEIR